MSIDLLLLKAELQAAALPVDSCALLSFSAPQSGYINSTFYSRAEGIVKVDWLGAVPPTSGQNSSAATVVAAHGGPRKPRNIIDIYNDLTQLAPPPATGAGSQIGVWSDLNSGTPKKYLGDTGLDQADISLWDWVIRFSGLGNTALNDARLRLTANYVRDNPKYLVNPSFDPTINIPGDQPG